MTLQTRIERLENIKINKDDNSRAREYFESIIDVLTEAEKNDFLDLFEKYPIAENECWNDKVEKMKREDREVYNLILEIGLERIKQHESLTNSSDKKKMFVVHG